MMRSFVLLTTFVSLACSLAGAVPVVQTVGSSSSIAAINPFHGHTFFNSPTYRPKVIKAAADIAKSGDPKLAAKALRVAGVSTFLWVSDSASIPDISTWLKEARLVQLTTRKKQVVQLVVYNLPDRDCSAKASSGELDLANGGEEKYKTFIQKVRAQLVPFPDVRVVIQLETDAIGNFVSNLAVEKCANAAPAQKRSYAYAIANLQLPNVALYIDGAHAGWLGWSSNIGPAADTMIEILNAAKKLNPKSKVRGVATNVSNYNGLGNQLQEGRDELVYIQDLAPLLAAQGWNAHFIVDQGRSGNQEAARSGGDWCNFKSAGFGPRPSTNTPSELIDAIVWVKPGGESDGTSDTSSQRYDEACGSETSVIPSPEAGTWNQKSFALMVQQANPAF